MYNKVGTHIQHHVDINIMSRTGTTVLVNPNKPFKLDCFCTACCSSHPPHTSAHSGNACPLWNLCSVHLPRACSIRTVPASCPCTVSSLLLICVLLRQMNLFIYFLNNINKLKHVTLIDVWFRCCICYGIWNVWDIFLSILLISYE